VATGGSVGTANREAYSGGVFLLCRDSTVDRGFASDGNFPPHMGGSVGTVNRGTDPGGVFLLCSDATVDASGGNFPQVASGGNFLPHMGGSVGTENRGTDPGGVSFLLCSDATVDASGGNFPPHSSDCTGLSIAPGTNETESSSISARLRADLEDLVLATGVARSKLEIAIDPPLADADLVLALVGQSALVGAIDSPFEDVPVFATSATHSTSEGAKDFPFAEGAAVRCFCFDFPRKSLCDVFPSSGLLLEVRGIVCCLTVGAVAEGVLAGVGVVRCDVVVATKEYDLRKR
jgi:hypothetical protein